MMRALVIGQGGREHAMVRALRMSPSVSEVHALPGSEGMAHEARCHDVNWQNFEEVIALVARESIDLVVIGPEAPLVEGLSDALREKDIPVFGPSRAAAQLEGSKIFSKDFMIEAGIPTARSFVVSSVEETEKAAANFQAPFVLKADGLAAGKGVFICKTKAELLAAAHSIFVDHSLGEAGATALLEEFQPGYEISYLVLTNGESFEPLPLAQDHKRLLDGDEGPNTGGMGVVAPVEMDTALLKMINDVVVRPTIQGLKKRGYVYRGVIFIGLMMTEQGPSVLEYNTRFGDPETQALLPLLDGDWGQVFSSLAKGELPILKWKKAATCCVVMAANGYPDQPIKGALIKGLKDAPSTEQQYFIHAGTKKEGTGEWATAGGRVLGAIGVGKNLREARDLAYQQAASIEAGGALIFRKDIGAKVIK